MSRIPIIMNKYRVCIICEGLEESEYIKKINSLNVWSNNYEFHPKNAGSASNIFPIYQDAFQNDRYEIIIVFCDTDKKPYREFKKIKKSINEFHDKEFASNKITIYANPCTLQIVLSHFGDVSLLTQSKKVNAQKVFDLTGIKNYDAHREQLNSLCSKITKANYLEMKHRVLNINKGEEYQSSTNFYDFLVLFESNDVEWINKINKYLMES